MKLGLGLGLTLGLCLGLTKQGIYAPAVDTAVKTVALIGDSITSQNDSSNDREFTSKGYMTWLNARTGQRYYYQPSHNLGASGQAVAATLSGITALAALDPVPDLVFWIPFANDIVGARTYEDLISDFDDVVTYVTGTLGAEMVIGTPLPRTQDGGSALTTAQQTLLDNLKSYILALNVSGVTVVNIYDNMTSTGDNPDPAKFDNESGKYLHPNPNGAYQIAVDMAAALSSVYGTFDIPDMSTSDLTINTDFSGTGGAESSPLTSASVADGFTFYAYTNLDVANSSVTKDGSDKQNLVVEYNNDLSYDIYEMRGDDIVRSGNFSTGQQYYMELEVDINSASNVRTACGIKCIVESVGTFKCMSPYDINAWPESFTGTLHLRTPVFTIAAGTNKIDPDIEGQMNSVGIISNLDVTLKQVRLVQV